jgi:transposase
MHKPKLRGQQAQAIALASQGLNRHEIADAMTLSCDHLNMVFRRAAAKGYDVPPHMPRRPPTGVATADLLKTRAKLQAQGVTETSALNRMIAERYRLDVPTVRMRLLRHDRDQQASGASL